MATGALAAAEDRATWGKRAQVEREQLLENGFCSGGGEVEAEKSGRKNLKTSVNWRECGLGEKKRDFEETFFDSRVL